MRPHHRSPRRSEASTPPAGVTRPASGEPEAPRVGGPGADGHPGAAPVPRGRRRWLPDPRDAGFVVLLVGALAVADLLRTPDGVSLWYPPAAVTVAYLWIRPGPVPVVIAAAARVAAVLVVVDPPTPLWLLTAGSIISVGVYAATAGVIRRLLAGAADPARILGAGVVAGAVGPLTAALATGTLAVATGRRSPGRLLDVAVDFAVGDAVAVLTLAPAVAWVLARLTHGPSGLLVAPRAQLMAAVLGLGVGGAAATRAAVDGQQVVFLMAVGLVALGATGGIGAAAAGAATVGASVAVALAVGGVELPVTAVQMEVAVAALVAYAVAGSRDQLVATAAALDRARAAEADRAAELTRLVAVSPVPTVILDTSARRITFANRAAAELSGRSPDELVGTSGRDHLEDPSEADRIRARTALTGQHEGIVRLRTTRGVRLCQVGISRLLDGDRSIIQLNDVTDLIEAHEAVARANELLTRQRRALDRLASRIAHDLSTPVTAIAGFAQLVATHPEDPRVGEWATRISANASTLGRLIRETLDAARSAGDEDPGCDVVACAQRARRVLDSALEAAGADLRVVVADGHLPPVAVPELVLRQVLINLIDNAVKYRHPSRRPEIVLTVRTDPADPDRVRIEVADNGPGIPPAARAVIFTEGERAGARGAGRGMGLAACRSLLAEVDGTIDVDANVPVGTVFTVNVPALRLRRLT